MKQDDCYVNLEVRNNLHVKHIIAKTLTLEDETLQTNSNMLGNDVKKLYESQTNTNCYTDCDKQQLNSITSNLSFSKNTTEIHNIPVFYLPTVAEVSNIKLNENMYCIYSSNNSLMYRANIGGKTNDYYFKTIEPSVKVVFKMTNDHINVNIITSESSL